MQAAPIYPVSMQAEEYKYKSTNAWCVTIACTFSWYQRMVYQYEYILHQNMSCTEISCNWHLSLPVLFVHNATFRCTCVFPILMYRIRCTNILDLLRVPIHATPICPLPNYLVPGLDLLDVSVFLLERQNSVLTRLLQLKHNTICSSLSLI